MAYDAYILYLWAQYILMYWRWLFFSVCTGIWSGEVKHRPEICQRLIQRSIRKHHRVGDHYKWSKLVTFGCVCYLAFSTDWLLLNQAHAYCYMYKNSHVHEYANSNKRQLVLKLTFHQISYICQIYYIYSIAWLVCMHMQATTKDF